MSLVWRQEWGDGQREREEEHLKQALPSTEPNLWVRLSTLRS